MRQLYKEKTANYPRIKTDTFFADYSNEYKYTGIIDQSLKFAEKTQLLRPELWKRFVNQYIEKPDSNDYGWRGEYWGKMMRGACFVYSYSKNPELYRLLTQTIEDMMSVAESDGRISTYKREREFDGWDIWSRKYVLLGMQYFLEICDDEELKERVIASMSGQVDYIMSKIGEGEEKKKITTATRHWRGLNSASLLEPIVRLYTLTGEQRFFDFASYIVSCGGTDIINIFELAYKDELKPYQYPVTKAYEMTSCFEGLLEYYRIVGTPWHKEALINFADRILENDFTVTGGCGCTSEYFDHSTVRQANTTNESIMQETCVTVTMMKFFYQLHILTGNSKYADAFEISFYNAYLGSLNTEGVIGRSNEFAKYPDIVFEALAYDSYSPLTAGMRGNEIGGCKVMSDNHYYGCCACIGSLGSGLVPKMHLLSTEKGFVMNMFIGGTVTSTAPNGQKVTFETKTEYPKFGDAEITVKTEKNVTFELKLRKPYWSKKTKIQALCCEMEDGDGYFTISKEWKNGDTVKLSLDMRTELIKPIPYGEQLLVNTPVWGGANSMLPTYDKEDPKAKRHIALRRGPIVLAQDLRLGFDLSKPAGIIADKDGYVDVRFPETETAPYKNILELEVPTNSGDYITLTDCSSAGKLWDESSLMAIWILNE